MARQERIMSEIARLETEYKKTIDIEERILILKIELLKIVASEY